MSEGSNLIETFIPIIFAAILALMYIFGRIIEDAKPQRNDKNINYSSGGLFILVFMALPYAIVHIIFHYFIPNDLLTNFGLIGSYLLIIFALLLQLVFYVHLSNKVNKKDYRLIFLGFKNINVVHIAAVFVAVITSYMVAYTSYYIFVKNPDPEPILAAFLIAYTAILALFTFVMIAVFYGHGSIIYPYVKVSFISEQNPIEGSILKFGDNISLLNNHGQYIINNTDVSVIEFKNNNTNIYHQNTEKHKKYNKMTKNKENLSEGIFYAGIIVGFLFGLLGNFIVTLFFRIFSDKIPLIAEVVGFILALFSTIAILAFLYYRLFNLWKLR